MTRTTPRRLLHAVVVVPAATGVLLLAAAGSALAQDDQPDCAVPPALRLVAAEVDPDSLEGCDYFEDPNFHENRKANGTYNPNGPFSLIFRR